MITIDDYKNYVSDFMQYLFEDGKSENTIASYVGDVEMFYKWLASKETVVDGMLKRFYITSYKKFLVNQKYKVNTINKKLNSLVCYNQYLISQSIMGEMVVNLHKDKLKIADGSEHSVAVLSDTDKERLLFFIQDQSVVSIRDKTIIMVLFYCGVRVTELVSTRIADIDFISRELSVFSKGGKLRTIPLRDDVISSIKEYMETERRLSKFNGSEYLFLSNRSGKMDRDAVAKRLKKYGNILGLHLNPHLFRHTLASNLCSAGVNISTVSKILGHSNIQVTNQYYVNISSEEKQRAVDIL